MALTTPRSVNRWAIVLAAGNGERLREFVYQRRGDYLPKQYNNFIGKRSLLEHTFHRAEKLLPANRIFVVVAREHLTFEAVRRQLGSRPPGTVVSQPENKDTAPGILLPLLHVQKRDRDAVVVVFPSDHFIREEDRFMRHVEQAFRLAEDDGSRIIVLGTEPNEPDPEYGYIVPGEVCDDRLGEPATRVAMFVEKPPLATAGRIIRTGALWNTLVFVAKLKTLLAVFQRQTPGLYRAFETIAPAIGTSHERSVTAQVYRNLPPVNFSKNILEALPYDHRRNLLVLPIRDVTWNDWGNAARLLATLRQLGKSHQIRHGNFSANESFARPPDPVRPGVAKRS